jgi:uncharacterized membrane protein YdjX (TVP38/TMEM64 family)
MALAGRRPAAALHVRQRHGGVRSPGLQGTTSMKRKALRPGHRSPRNKAGHSGARKARGSGAKQDAGDGAVAASPLWIPAAGALGFLALGFAWLLLPLDEWMTQFSEWINSFGAAGVAGFALFYVAATLMLMPGTPLSIAAGIAYGWWALPLVIGAGLASATLAFMISRHLLRARVLRMLELRPQMQAAEEAVNEEGWKVVGLLRLSPVFPFAAQNYFFGMTGLALPVYLAVTAVAVLPGGFLNVYLGVLGRQAAQNAGPLTWSFLIVGLAATVVVMVLVTRKARQKLREHGVKA